MPKAEVQKWRSGSIGSTAKRTLMGNEALCMLRMAQSTGLTMSD